MSFHFRYPPHAPGGCPYFFHTFIDPSLLHEAKRLAVGEYITCKSNQNGTRVAPLNTENYEKKNTDGLVPWINYRTGEREVVGSNSTRTKTGTSQICIFNNDSNFARFARALSIKEFKSDDSNDNDRKQNHMIGCMRRNNRATRVARTSVDFFDVACQMAK